MHKIFLPLIVSLAFLFMVAPSQAVGTGTFSDPITWANTGDLRYRITGGPPNTCGDLWSNRNGGGWVMQAAGWACTDSSGAVTKGPWTWAGQVGDETAYVLIAWPVPFGNTNIDDHIWDKTCSTTTESVNGSPPPSFSGNAVDVPWGAGFNGLWSICFIDYLNTTTSKYWDPATNAYTASAPPIIGCTISGMPAMSVTWNATQVPSVGAHVPGQCYSWIASVTDGYCSIPDTHNFCY